jgi:type I restriction-modification system DNA methylase subunit
MIIKSYQLLEKIFGKNSSMINEYIEHSRNHSYMSGIQRDKLRVKETAEVFTPTLLVQEMLNNLPQELFEDSTKTFLDPSCGDGQFLSEVVIRKMERSGCTLEQALSTTYGVELMEDNVKLCKERLAGTNPTQEILDLLDRNIVCADALTYHYRFDGTPSTSSLTEIKLGEFFG